MSKFEFQWLEETFTSVERGSNYRAYVVCEVDKETVDNWLKTPFIERGQANRLYVEITFTMRDCREFPRTARTCRETFTLLYHETDYEYATAELPQWAETANAYRRIDRITGDKGRFTRNENNEVINTEVRSVPLVHKGVYFSFRDEGACTSILAVRVRPLQYSLWFRLLQHTRTHIWHRCVE